MIHNDNAKMLVRARKAAEPAFPLRVLIVDDCPDITDILAELLRRHGRDVRVACDPLTALKAAAEFEPQIALLDISMPELDGCRLATEFRRSPGLLAIRLIAVTAFRDKTYQDLAAEAGFDGYIMKPFAIGELNDAINSAQLEPGKTLV
jgi:DNA-binding response OmpR family regulator